MNLRELSELVLLLQLKEKLESLGCNEGQVKQVKEFLAPPPSPPFTQKLHSHTASFRFPHTPV